MVENHTKDRLARGELALGVGLRQARTVDIGKIMKTAGFDWLFIDMEHNAMGIDIATQIAVAAQDAGITPLVRVPGHEPFHASRALDGGAQGIVVPHVNTADEAAGAVAACRYPPLGHRSMTGALPQIDFRSAPAGEAAVELNEATLLVVMVETPAAVNNVDAIAATPGVDAVLIGTNDLCLEMGIPGEYGDPRVVSAYQALVDACRAHGKYAGMGGIYQHDLLERYIAMGVQLVLTGSDLSFMLNGAKAQASAVRAMQ